MEQIKIVKILYIFSLLILLGFATSATLAFPDVANYAYSIAICIHSCFILVLFFMYIKNDKKVETDEPTN